MSGNSTKVRKKAQSQGKVTERLGNLFSQGNLIVADQQSDLPILYSCCNSFFIRDVCGEFGLINVHLRDILPAISSGKVRDFFSVWSVVTQKRIKIMLSWGCHVLIKR